MCGIAGVYSTSFNSSDLAMFEQLLFLNVYRGEDSTGVIKINQTGPRKKKKTTYHRQRSLSASPIYLRSKESDFIEDKSAIGLVGHCRAATVGDVKLSNAHPFRFNNVVGVHYGTIRQKFKGASDFDTDSEALYKLINDEGIESALNEVADFDSAYALVWVDKSEDTLNFIRNAKRPLWFTRLFGGTTLVWSSDPKTLKYAVEYANLVPMGLPDGVSSNVEPKQKYWTLSENTMMSLSIGDPCSDLRLKGVNVKKRSTYLGYTSGYSYDNPKSSHTTTGVSKNTYYLPDKSQRTQGGSGTDPDDYFPGFQGELWNRSAMERKLSFGCFCCQSVVDIDDNDLDRVKWFDETSYACGDCYDDSPDNWVAELFRDVEETPFD